MISKLRLILITSDIIGSHEVTIDEEGLIVFDRQCVDASRSRGLLLSSYIH